MLLLSQIQRHRFTTRLQVLLGHSSEELALSPTLRVLQNLRTVEDVQFRLTDGSHLTISKESWRLRISSLIHPGLKLRTENLKKSPSRELVARPRYNFRDFLGEILKNWRNTESCGIFCGEIRIFSVHHGDSFISYKTVLSASSKLHKQFTSLNFTRPQFLEVYSIWRTKQTASAGHFTSYLEGLETSTKMPEPTTILLGGIPERNLGVICI